MTWAWIAPPAARQRLAGPSSDIPQAYRVNTEPAIVEPLYSVWATRWRPGRETSADHPHGDGMPTF